MRTPSLSTPPAGPLLVCVSGPDQGRRFVLTEHKTTLGRATGCPLLSDDPDVAGHRVALFFLRVFALTAVAYGFSTPRVRARGRGAVGRESVRVKRIAG